MAENPQVVVIGAGPAGLTAAYELTKRDVPTTVLEGDAMVGGISRTAEREGWRFDIGGHRFFTKVPEVEALWHEILPAEEFIMRPRMSRIYYNGKLFDYPLKAGNALRGLGILEAIRCLLSYVWARLRPPKDQSNFEGWVSARFGYRLYRIFFKTYTEKVWGVPATEIQADWAAQRIKNLSLLNAIVNAVKPKSNQKDITSLIEEFQYPKCGPGMMWETCTEKVRDAGGRVVLEEKVKKVGWERGHGVTGVTTFVTGGYGPGAGAPEASRRDLGSEQYHPADHVISSMAFSSLVLSLDPPAPAHVQAAAKSLRYRDFLTVALVVPESAGFPDNWVYVHSPDVKLGRIQNFGSWSPYLVKEGRTCLGLEYFVTVGDETWTLPDEDLIALGIKELASLGLVPADQVERGFVVRMPKAYPFYDEHYKHNVDVMRHWLAENVPNLHPVGRNGMHRYNNQDHSMFTALLTVQNIADGTAHDVWAVNVEEDYHEEISPGGGAGRAARQDDGSAEASRLVRVRRRGSSAA
ncbi:MAG: NAD(P)/FAD-dependent oxidoreductase [Frankiaceae bacterium]